jgi:hypothetical protein
VKKSPSLNSRKVSDYPLTTYRVRICKTCCGETGHIELGTYNDQESAILVNDAFEITEGRFSRLSVLCPEDQPYFNRLSVQHCDRAKGDEQVGILEVIAERKKHVNSHLSNNNGIIESRKRSSPSSGSRHSELNIPAKRRNRGSPSASTSVTSEESLSHPSSNGQIRDTRSNADISSQGGNNDDFSGDDSTSISVGDCETAMVVEANDILSPTGIQEEKRPSPVSALKLMDDNSLPNLSRQRSYTFSTASEYFPALNNLQTGIETLTWIASLDEREADVALSLFALAGDDQSVSESTPPVGDFSDKSEGENDSTFNNRGRSDSFAEVSDESKSSKPSSGKKQVVIVTPRKDSAILEDIYDQEEIGVIDKLSLLARSAGLLASPVQHSGQFQYPLVLSPYRPLNTSQDTFALNESTFPPPSSYRRARSQSMSAIDPPLIGFGGANNAANILKSNLNDPNALPIMRVLHQSHSHLLLQSLSGAGLRRDGFIGIYSPEERKIRIERFLEKRKHRMWLKKVKYDVRKNFADSRVRIKGRFVKKEEEKIALLVNVTDEKSSNASMTPTSGSAKKSTGKCKDAHRATIAENDGDDDIDCEDE